MRDIARELTRDVRETVRSLRDEFTWAVREAGRTGNDQRRDRPADAGSQATADQAGADAEQAQARADAAQAAADQAQVKADAAQAVADGAHAQADAAEDGAHAAEDAARDQAQAAAEAAGGGSGSVWSTVAGESAAASEGRDSEPGGDQADAPAGAGADADAQSAAAGTGQGEEAQAGARQRRWPSGGWREWAEWAERGDWREWADWAEQRDWRDWAGKQEWRDRAKASHKEWKEWAKAGKQEWAASGRARKAADRELVVDLERLAAAFAREIRGVAWQAEALSEDAVGDLGRILTDALNRIRNEVFRPPGPGEKET